MMLTVLLDAVLKTPKLMGLFFLGVSSIPGYYIFMTVRTIQFVNKIHRTGVQAAGVIISQREVQSARAGSFETYLIPMVRYKTLDGIIVEGESKGGYGGVEFYNGQEAYVYYDATKPTDFLFVQELAPSSPTYLMLLIAALLLAGMLWVAIKLLFT